MAKQKDEAPTPEVVAPAVETAPEEPKDQEANLLDQLLRLKAEFENYRKRVDKEKPEYVRLGRIEVLGRLLPLYDLMQKAHQEVHASHNDTPLAKGMEGIFKEFEKIFKDEGVTPMDPLGKPFDAQRHEVFGTEDRADGPEGLVVDVLQNGFLLQDRVLRTAKVRISRQPPKSQGPASAGA